MDENKTPNAEIENLEIDPLSDEDLDSVAGGITDPVCSGCGSQSQCSNTKPPVEQPPVD